MNWFRRVMIGRYGGDQLSIALIILSVLITWIGQLTRIQILIWIGNIPLWTSIFRTLSRNIPMRSMENQKFNMIMSPVYSRFRKIQYYVKESETHRRFRCPNCGVKLWVPRGKGKIIVTCPKCKTEFRERT